MARSTRPDPQAQAADRRRRRRRVVVHPRRRRGGRDRRRRRARRHRRLQRRRRRPAPVSEWLPYLAAQLGAKPPRRVPVWLARLAVGEVGISMMTQIRGSSNAKARARARLGAGLEELARRLPAGVRRSGPGAAERPSVGARERPAGPRGCRRIQSRRLGRGLRGSAAAAVLDRLPDARERRRGRGHRPGGVLRYHRALASRAPRSSRPRPTSRQSRRGSRSTTCARPACARRATSASGCPSRC